MRISALALLLAGARPSPAQSPFTLASTNDGNGLFSYTFNPGDANFVMTMIPGFGQIIVPSYGVLSVSSPAGWSASVDNDVVTWQPLSGSAYLGTPPLTFSIQSSSTQSAFYPIPVNNPYAGGLVGGVVHFLDIAGQQSDGEGAPGFFGFSFIGPAVIPEPSSIAFFLLGALTIGFARRVLRSSRQATVRF